MNGRGRVALVALAVLAVYLIGYAVKVAEDNRELQKANRAAIAKLESSQQNAVDVLSKILAQAQQAEQAGLVEKGAVDRILERVEGLDPEIIERAVEEAKRLAGRPAVPGPQGPPGPPGPAGAGATTSTAPATTTSTTRPPTTTTSATTTTTTTRPPTTTTTTRPCVANVLGLVKVGC